LPKTSVVPNTFFAQPEVMAASPLFERVVFKSPARTGMVKKSPIFLSACKYISLLDLNSPASNLAFSLAV